MTQGDDLNIQPTIQDVVHRFVTAEQTLVDLQSERQRLLDATQRFIASDEDVRSRSSSALEALEEARARLREQYLASEGVTKTTGDLQTSTVEVLDEVGRVLETLREIDPAAMTRELSDLRRDSHDNAAEVRELRRLVAELQRSHDQIVQTHSSLVTTHEATGRRLRLLLPIGLITLLAAISCAVLVAIN